MTRRGWVAGAAGVAAVLLVGRLIAGAYVEYRFFHALGAGALSVWRVRTRDLLLLRGVAVLAATAFAFANLYGVRASVESLVLPRRLGNLEIGEEITGHRLALLAAAIALVVGLALGAFVSDWAQVELARSGGRFGLPEPYTGHDLGYFLYWLPLEESIYGWSLLVLLVVSALVLVLYGLTTSLRWDRGRVRMTGHVRRHLAVLGALLIALVAWGHRLDGYTLLSLGSGQDGAFTRIDRVVGLPARFGLAGFTALAAFVVLRAAWLGQTRLVFWTVTTVLLSALVFREIVPAVAARTAPPRYRATHEPAHQANRAAFTQLAFDVTRVSPAPGGYGLSAPSELAAAVPVWDPPALSAALERARRAGTPVADVGWQPIGGQLTGVAVTRTAQTPEVATTGTPPSVPAWDVSIVSGTVPAADGGPLLLGTDGQPRPDADPALELHPLVHPNAPDFALVDDSTGTVAGDPAASFGGRLAHAWRLRDFRLVFSNDVERLARPEIVLRRDVRTRVGALAPYFAQGNTLSPVLVGDSLFWVLHLYSASNHFPLSQHYGVAGTARSYFRLAAVAAVNAATGRVTFVAAPDPDPIAATWLRRFPRLFTSPGAVPPALAAALPPPVDGVVVQSWVMASYGARRDLNAGDLSLAGGMSGDSVLGATTRALALLPAAAPVGPPRVLGWTLPLLGPSTRVAGVLVALGGPAPQTRWLAPAASEPRWRDVNDQLRASVDSASAPAPSGADGDVNLGRMRVLPVGGRLVYVLPAYVRAPDGTGAGGRARLAVVAAAREGRSAAAPDLGALLGVGSASGIPVAGPPETRESLQARVRALYASMRESLRRGDWRAFGAAFDSLGAVVGGGSR
jgi:hypothetical protein